MILEGVTGSISFIVSVGVGEEELFDSGTEGGGIDKSTGEGVSITVEELAVPGVAVVETLFRRLLAPASITGVDVADMEDLTGLCRLLALVARTAGD